MTNSLITERDRFAAANPESRIELNGRDWGILDKGAGEVLLLIPGTLGRGDIFWRQIDALSDRLRIIAVSYPDSGGIEDWSADLKTLLDLKDIDNVHLLGSSLGGYLAQYFAGHNPDRVNTLFAANTLHSVTGMDQRLPYSLDLDTTPINQLRAGFAQGLNAWRDAHADQAELVELLMQEANGRILEAEMRARLKALKIGPELPPNTGKIITIEAADDPLIPQEMRDAVRTRLNPDTAYRFLWGGHFPYITRSALYTSMLEKNLGLNVTGPKWGDGDMCEQ